MSGGHFPQLGMRDDQIAPVVDAIRPIQALGWIS